MKYHFKKLLVLSTIFLSAQAFACQFNTDCNPGSKCLKDSDSIYGVCAEGISPGNSNDRQPVKAPLDLDGTYGNTCSFDTDCGVRNKCYKKSGSIYGVCLKGN